VGFFFGLKMSVGGYRVVGMNTAQITKTLVDDAGQYAACYKLTPAIVDGDMEFTYVFVSAVNNSLVGRETMVFGTSNANADEVDWTGLIQIKAFDHTTALADLGYQIV
jgi:hypothetical protein